MDCLLKRAVAFTGRALVCILRRPAPAFDGMLSIPGFELHSSQFVPCTVYQIIAWLLKATCRMEWRIAYMHVYVSRAAANMPYTFQSHNCK